MSLRDEGFKFCISPDKQQGQWLHPKVFKVIYPDWTDVTEWPTEQLVAYLMPAPQQHELFAA
ncbi:hypothetical protein C3E97_020475 [Pseudomonas sp. MWU12-2115]|uniref:hypothetical protein n=1 Tax=unclassified Pseudomonas TaxID=196821 RepID=UPI000CD5A27C|nr:hypothetical protein [Pseudomonas sp. MWU12-2020]RBB99649.1 hypothetical protein C3E97_020475 [Pseudomonas sp. MWU12-2115]